MGNSAGNLAGNVVRNGLGNDVVFLNLTRGCGRYTVYEKSTSQQFLHFSIFFIFSNEKNIPFVLDTFRNITKERGTEGEVYIGVFPKWIRN